MSYGKMNGFAVIKSVYKDKDEEGFAEDTELIIATVRCYREGRHGSKRWLNLSAFTDATDLFRFRVLPDITIPTVYVIDYVGERFKIISAENVKGRGMYIDVLAKEVKPSG